MKKTKGGVMKKKPINPYEQLRDTARKWAESVLYPHIVKMWFYPKNRLSESWKLDDLYERVAAANQLGYDVELIAGDDGLHVRYVKRPTDAPWQIS